MNNDKTRSKKTYSFFREAPRQLTSGGGGDGDASARYVLTTLTSSLPNASALSGVNGINVDTEEGGLTTIGCNFGQTENTVCEGNDSRLTALASTQVVTLDTSSLGNSVRLSTSNGIIMYSTSNTVTVYPNYDVSSGSIAAGNDSRFKNVVATDSNTLVHWSLDSDPPCANTGVGGTLALSTASGTVTTIQTCIGRVLRLSSGMLQTPTTTIEPGNSFSVSLWVCCYSFSSNVWLVAKQYNDTASSPYESFVIQLNSSNNGGWAGGVTISGGNNFTFTDTNKFRMTLNEPALLAMTYNGTTQLVSLYHNGILATSATLGGSVDYGSHGRYVVGGFNNTQELDGWVSDVRVDNVVRPQTYYESMYKARMGWGT